MQQWVVSDVHGCIRTLKKLLEDHIGLSKENEYYFLGDLIDRGNHSKEVLDYIISLQTSGYKVFSIVGNHEYMLLQAYDAAKKITEKKWFQHFKQEKLFCQSWHEQLGEKTLRSFNVQLVTDIPTTYIDWLKTLPYYYILPHAILTHAGLNCKLANPLEATEEFLFGINCFYDKQWLEDKIVIHGHHVLPMDNIEMLIENVEKHRYICIDNGCVYAGKINDCGYLLGMEINTKEIKKQINID
ncbi:MAG: serine/threonine protein phosphatase [Bacteroidales bacterium]|nr:serine/threonine protein phosphatase [Bacteroidales bacterium]